MLRPKQISAGVVSLAKVAARVVVAACLALSFFASLLPLRASADAGVMACCAGKAGHCNSGLISKQQAKPEPQPQSEPKPASEPEPEPMCGQKPSAGKGDATPEDAITVIAASSEVGEQVSDQRGDGTQKEVQDAAKSPSSDATAAMQNAALTKPCPADCRAGAAGVVRQPRPREIALLAKNTRGSLPELANWKPNSLQTSPAAAATLKRSRPRGPPSFS